MPSIQTNPCEVVYFIESSKGTFIPMKQEQLSNKNTTSHKILFNHLANYN